MITTGTYYQKVCMEAWMNCENVLIGIAGNGWSDKHGIRKLCDECAEVCLGLLQAIKDRSVHTRNVLFLCMGICEECADMCEQFYRQPIFNNCAQACRKCADVLSQYFKQPSAS